MNRHLYGGLKNLSLENLAKPHLANSWAGGPLWRQSTFCTDQIISNELFLCFTHIMERRATEVRDAIDEGRHCVCMHVATDPVDLESPRADLDRITALEQPEGGMKKRSRVRN
ncbi:hypothetical protein V8C37DRAFT_268037 [Trichoderma ceciliae]